MLANRFKYKIKHNGLDISEHMFSDYRIAIEPVSSRVRVSKTNIDNTSKHGTCSTPSFARERTLNFKGVICGRDAEETQIGRDKLCGVFGLPSNPACGEHFELCRQDLGQNARRAKAKVVSPPECTRGEWCIAEFVFSLQIDDHKFFGECRKYDCKTTVVPCGMPLVEESGECKVLSEEICVEGFCRTQQRQARCMPLVNEECVTGKCIINHQGKTDADVLININGDVSNLRAHNFTNNTSFAIDGEFTNVEFNNTEGSTSVTASGVDIRYATTGPGITLAPGYNCIIFYHDGDPVDVCVQFYNTYM